MSHSTLVSETLCDPPSAVSDPSSAVSDPPSAVSDPSSAVSVICHTLH